MKLRVAMACPDAVDRHTLARSRPLLSLVLPPQVFAMSMTKRRLRKHLEQKAVAHPLRRSRGEV